MFFLIRPTQNIVVDFQGYPIFRRVTGTGTLQLDISFFNQSPYFYYLQIWTNNSFMLQASLNISGTFNPTNLPLLMTGVANGIANGNIGRYNGATLATTPLNNATTFVNLTGVTIDLIGANDARNFDTAEILLYGRVLTASEYEQVEGYLAWKWGLVGNLPITHPFRFIPPIFSLPVPPTPISSFDFNNYTASSSTLANSIAGGGAMTVYLPANNTFVTSSPGNFHLTIFAPNNFPSSTGGLSVATVTNARTIEMWVRYDGVAGNLGYGQYFLDARNGLTNGYWITSANSTADNIGGGNADFNNGIFYNNGTPTTINAVAGTPLVGPVLINTGWRQIVIVLPNSFTDDIAFFIRFSLDIQGMPISVAQISIYNEALSQAQVRSLFNSKRTRYGLSPI
jgi:hypothetical protein